MKTDSKQSGILIYCVTGTPRVKKNPVPKGASAKKVKKRNPWSDDESKSDSDLENSEPIIPRETKSQRASGTILLYMNGHIWLDLFQHLALSK